MAGTLMLTVKVAHIYQRRFSNADLDAALRITHLYLITRRPRVALESMRVKVPSQGLGTGHFAFSSSTGKATLRALDFSVPAGTVTKDMHIYADGSYFSISAPLVTLHGDSWSLASMATGAALDTAKHEVLYVGQAFGTAGSESVPTRTKRHETLQKIYEDHHNSEWDVFVAPLLMTEFQFTNDDHIDDMEDGPSLDKYFEYFINLDRRPQKTAVDLIEHSLISFFQPPYNEQLRNWNANSPTSAMRKMQDAGFRLLQVHLDGWGGLARFYSAAAPSLPRSRLISLELPSPPKRPKFRRVDIAEDGYKRKVGPESWLIDNGQEVVTNMAEDSVALLKVFGPNAPALRRPPQIEIQEA